MDRLRLNVLDALELTIPELESYLQRKLNTPVKTPLTLVYEHNGQFVYEDQYNPAYKKFVGIFIGGTLFYNQMFNCEIAQKPLNRILGEDLNVALGTKMFPQTAYLIGSREKNLIYENQEAWNRTVRILADRHIKMSAVKKIGGNLFNDPDRGGLQVYCAATNEYCKMGDWRGTMMICSGKV